MTGLLMSFDNNYVVIAFKGELGMTADLVDQLIEQRQYRKIFLMNNGPEADAEVFYGLPGVEVIQCENDGIHYMFNLGLAFSRYDGGDRSNLNVVILNNDLRLCSGYIGELVATLRSNPFCAIASGTEHAAATDRIATYDTGLQGNAVALKGELQFLYFDPQFTWWFGDVDVATRAQQFGYHCLIAGKAVHEHLGGGSVTTRAQDPEWFAAYQTECAKDTDKFYAKWPHITPPDRWAPLPE